MKTGFRFFAFLLLSVLLLTAFAALTPATAATYTQTVGKGKTELTAADVANYSRFESIRIADGVTKIADGTFEGWHSLKTVQFPESLQSIGSNAFKGCSYLQKLTFPDGLQSIGKHAFSSCTNLKSVQFGTGMRTIDENAFSSCWNLQTVTLNDGLQSIGKFAFYSCLDLTSIRIPESVTFIGSGAFYSCSLKYLYFDAVCCSDADLQSYYRMFSAPYNDSVISIGPKVTRIPANFLDATKIQSITIPANVTEIGEHAFTNCWELEEVTFENPYTKVEKHAFNDVSLIGLNFWMLMFGISNPWMGILYTMLFAIIYIGQGVLLTVANLRLTRRRFGQDVSPLLMICAGLTPWLLLGVLYWMVMTITKPPMTTLPPSFGMQSPPTAGTGAPSAPIN